MRLDRTGLAIGVTAAIAMALLAGCKKEGATDALKEATAAALEKATDAKPGQADDAADAGQAAVGEFDISSVPLSTVALGDFPYLTLPAGYVGNGDAETKRIARFPFWVKGRAHWVEGRFYLVNVYPEKEGDYNPYELRKNLEALVAQMGGVKLSEEKIPYDIIKSWGDEITMGFLKGLGDIYNVPASTYVVRRDDGNIWIHFAQDTAQGGLIVGQEKAFVATAQLLPASEMKKQLDAAGKVALQVNFATDKTDVLPDSLPQIEQVAELMKIDGALKLAVNGHTDDSGDAAHNQRLSEGRAKAVVALLAGKGIEASRLTAAGFGSTQPVADNGTQEGKAKNRRVELVKR
ncbi:OmpA family protein [Thermomonas fusca]|uniref:OmpA family protein n=1 Tax=Thermomonas fusca TaxID=215690 RepID=UPI0004129634|nr:OmpA family protein [Thermomonas fusca]